jgi:hypothetical protein
MIRYQDQCPYRHHYNDYWQMYQPLTDGMPFVHLSPVIDNDDHYIDGHAILYDDQVSTSIPIVITSLMNYPYQWPY